ncbi:hypothetical protein [Schleiferia thermophila]|uniref:Uncharacterized protein n=1 Tax=Schleiferia thermophila TaxID=884107 RepID=A0A368ZYB2_9FLAO|nr:hypothetical protein [Schleiferia thermophila]RCX01923.1 hypothetical protein DES35_10622 [Schleiferia thermophila]GCD79770.1 hypothetical protein JCM30197_10170 [Schleiferia thermophila]
MRYTTLRSFTLLLFSLSFSFQLKAQKVRSFSADTAAWKIEVLEILKDQDKDRATRIVNHIAQILSTGKLSRTDFELIVKTSNTFLKKRMLDLDAWEHWFRILAHMAEQEDTDKASKFHRDFEVFAAKNPNKAIRDYLSVIHGAFLKSELYNDGQLRWVYTGVFEFEFTDEPLFKIPATDLYATFRGDSTFIEETGGIFYPKTLTWKGTGGSLYWERAGLSRDSATARFSDYQINVSKAFFEADSVTLYTQVYLKEPVLGRLEERLSSRNTPESAIFPRFYAYRNDILIKEILQDVDYIGGFSVVGGGVFASGTTDAPATLVHFHQKKPQLIVRGERFSLKPDLFTSEAVELSLMLDEDSIYHPRLYYRIVPSQRIVTLIRQEEGLGQSPFVDSYHKLIMRFQTLAWKMGEEKMIITNINQGIEIPATFESAQYYREERMDRLRGLSNKHPLMEVVEMSKYFGSETLEADKVAQYLRINPQNGKIFLMNLAIEGFLKYDLNTHTATILPRTYEYIDNYLDKRDFDVIQFVSSVSGKPNATLSLLTKDLIIDGVSVITLSDSQKVGLFPVDKKIVMHRNLNFDFAGRIVAGRFSFWGREFKFKYDNFIIDMPAIDSMRFAVESFEKDATGLTTLVNVQSVLADLTGQLDIDKPNNKSGRKSFGEYPIFRSIKESYVYYDKPSIHNGAYNKKNFYVRLEPFTIDSLDNKKTEGISFDGTLVSAGIFPDIQQTIKVQRDYSLGFEMQTAAEGLSAYGGKGTYSQKLSLSNLGLRGDGRIDYLTSSAIASEFFFFPDSTNALNVSYSIKEDSKYNVPTLAAQGVVLHWEPKNDVMFTKNTISPFQMYDDIKMKAEGTMALSPAGLTGNAAIAFQNSEMKSRNFSFRRREFSADTSNFRVRPYDTGPWVFETLAATAYVNFDHMKGNFTLHSPAQYMNFPEHQYIAFMDHADWHIAEKSIEVMKKSQMPSSRMVSTKREQDSLQFVANSVKLKMVENYLEVFKAFEIEVADATIYPDTGYVIIDPQAEMRTLQNAQIIANRHTKYHKFEKATVKIASRNNYSGSGYYDYIDEDNTAWPLYFEEISVNRQGVTNARAQIKEEDAFYLSTYFAFYGKALLTAPEKQLTFDGYTLIQHACSRIQTDWFPFKSIIDPNNIVIDLPETADELNKARIFNGIYISNDSTTGYSAFLSKESPKADLELILAGGQLYFDKSMNSYIITSAEKVKNPDAKGNYLALNIKTCEMYGEGRLSFGDRTGLVEIDAYGTIRHRLQNDEITIDMWMGFDFHFNDDVLKAITQKLKDASDLPSADLTRRAFLIAINEMLEGKERQRFLDEFRKTGLPEKVPKPFLSTITFSDLQLKWNPETNSFLSEGLIGIGTVGKTQINKKVNGIFEIARKRRGDEISIYIDLGKKDVYFFQYRRNVMEFYSPDQELLDIIVNTKPDARKKEEKGKQPYTYTAGTRGRLNRFLNRMDTDIE